VERKTGRLGQFDVLVDGKVIASRGGNILTQLLGGGWPDPEAVISRIEELQRERQKA
jgi:hypothetical protein